MASAFRTFLGIVLMMLLMTATASAATRATMTFRQVRERTQDRQAPTLAEAASVVQAAEWSYWSGWLDENTGSHAGLRVSVPTCVEGPTGASVFCDIRVAGWGAQATCNPNGDCISVDAILWYVDRVWSGSSGPRVLSNVGGI